MPDEPAPGQAESTHAWDTNAAFWDEGMGEGNSWHLQLIWPDTERLLGLQPGAHLLDVGCGNGLTCRRVALAGVNVTGIDVSGPMIERARARTTGDAAVDARITYRQVDATDEAAWRALGEHQFDAACANMVLMDVAEIAPLYRALPHLLRPGAPFVASVQHPAFNGSHAIHVDETEESSAGQVTRKYVKVRGYLADVISYGQAIFGQPVPQPYFHRSIQSLLTPAFEAGLVLDGLVEPAFVPGKTGYWGDLDGVPPVLIVRMRVPA
ncbi:MAG: class I SAM-dependent methyltransferase [Chloroflexi bacterium]|nr:class I SAM-dependent methyltransferase [Chloroflexota bacterium]MDA1241349.1 class I SAM-dependent methyltransferase [Chloroflexota bacterium]